MYMFGEKIRYRSLIKCLNCGQTYYSSLLKKPIPNKCKLCGSIRVVRLKTWGKKIKDKAFFKEKLKVEYAYRKKKKRKHKEKYLGKMETARRRGLHFHKLAMNRIAEEVDYHHINDIDVVAIPVDLHRLYKGEIHRDNLLPIVQQLYPKLKLMKDE